jgi:DNA-binding NtrC family response regulator
MPTSRRVLLVEHDPASRSALRDHLDAAGWDVAEADSIHSANARIAEGEFDAVVVLTDEGPIGFATQPLETRGLRDVLERVPRPVPRAPEDELLLPLREIERRHIERVLAAEGGHVERAAQRLGMARSTLYDTLRKLGIRK